MPSKAVIISADNRGPWINIVTWILGVLVCLAAFIKLLSKRVRSHTTQYDDGYVVAATLLALGYDITLSIQVKAGLGRHLSRLSDAQVLRYQQAAYASQILYVATLCLAKMAILQFMVSLARIKTRRRIVKGCMVFNLLSVMTAILAIAFQCPQPRPWAVLSHGCFNQAAFWDAFGVMDAFVELATALLPIYLLRDLHLAWVRKIPVMASFASRASLIPIIIVRLVYLNSASISTDHPFDDFTTVLTSSIQANLSVIVTCIPFIKPVMDSLQTGILVSDVHTTISPRHPSYALRWLGSSSATRAGSASNKWPKNSTHGNSTTATGGGPEEDGERFVGFGSEERMIIKQTKTVAVHTEP